VRIEWSAHAVEDLQAVSEYIEQDRNLETANRVTGTIYENSKACARCRTGDVMGT
jgi:plasmid stabilization system protein ParE